MTNTEKIQALKDEVEALSQRLEEAKKELLEERCAGLSRYAVGDVVLVPRKLFGKDRMWPARIATVNLYYNSGSTDGKPWETRLVSYSYFLQQKDCTFGGSSEGCYHADVRPAPVPQAE